MLHGHCDGRRICDFNPRGCRKTSFDMVRPRIISIFIILRAIPRSSIFAGRPVSMNYRMRRQGEDLGAFPLEELRRRLEAGELTGGEYVQGEGKTDWQPLGLVLQQ